MIFNMSTLIFVENCIYNRLKPLSESPTIVRYLIIVSVTKPLIDWYFILKLGLFDVILLRIIATSICQLDSHTFDGKVRSGLNQYTSLGISAACA